MVIANGVGMWLATLLVWPKLQAWIVPFTYGRWVPVHLNLHLYGWTSIPLLIWLIRLYRVEQSSAQRWVRSAFWAWSAALAVGALTWLMGQSSGKVFLDWTGFARVFLTLAMAWLWFLLALGWMHERHSGSSRLGSRVAKGLGLALLAAVPPVWFWSAGQAVYPAVNPRSGGPTGASLLGSTLIVICLLLLLPSTLGIKRHRSKRRIQVVWITFILHAGLFFGLDRSNSSNLRPDQILGLGSLLAWAGMLPWYYAGFHWPAEARLWQRAFLAWLILLLVTGWLSFLPGWLDRLKFTDGLVAHSHLAMAGFITSFNLFLVAFLAQSTAASFALARKPAFWLWNAGTFVYVLLMWAAGWMEGADPAFTMSPRWSHDLVYGLRLLCGIAMTSASVIWWRSTLSTEVMPSAESHPSEGLENDLQLPSPGRFAATL